MAAKVIGSNREEPVPWATYMSNEEGFL